MGVGKLPGAALFSRLGGLFDGEKLIAFDGVESLTNSGGPANFDVGSFGGAQAEVQALVV